MRFQRQSRPKGIALIIVLIVIMMLGILAGGFALSMKVETKLARNASMDADMEWLGRSGVELARYVLAEESSGPLGMQDSKMKKWAGGPGDTNSPVASLPLDHYEVGPGWVSVKITDNDSKFNINVANEMILRQALTLIGVDSAAHSTIIGSIIDWRDPDDQTHMSGSESDFYQSLQPPYIAKNGPVDDMAELLLVNGVTAPIFWGSGAAGHQQVLNRPVGGLKSRFEEPIYAIGLVDLFTAVSSRQVNLNTASATVLQLIPEIDENIANAIISGPGGRAGPDGSEGTPDDMPFRNPGELARIPMFANPAALGMVGQFFGVRSLVFEVQVEAHMGNDHRKFIGILRRNNPRDIQVLSFYPKSV